MGRTLPVGEMTPRPDRSVEERERAARRGALRSRELASQRRVARANSARRLTLLAFALLATSPARARLPRLQQDACAASISRSGRTRARTSRRRAGGSVTPGSCATPIRGPLEGPLSSISTRPTSTAWTCSKGTVTMCIDRGKFKAFGAENCWRRGLQAVTFAEIDTLRFARLDDVPHRPSEVSDHLPFFSARSPPPTGRPAAGSGSRASRDCARDRADRARGSTAPPFACAPRPRR